MANTFGNSGQVGLMLEIGLDAGTATKFTLDSAYVYETAAKDAIGIRFCSPVTQANGALLLYAMHDDTNGTPKYKCELRKGAAAAGADTKPEAGGAVLVTSDERTSPTDDRWEVFTFAGVSLTAGSYYWLVIYNSAADPPNHYGSWYIRGSLDGHGFSGGQHNYRTALRFFTSTTGFTTGSAQGDGIAPVVIKFADGSVMGFPYIVAGAAHASNTNYRGNRKTIPGNIVVNGLFYNSGAAAMNFVGIGSGAVGAVVSKTLDETGEDIGAYFVATTLTGATAYDYLYGYGSNSATAIIYAMIAAGDEAAIPADVLLAAIASYVDGAALNTLTATASMILGGMVIAYQDIPAAAGGGGGKILIDGAWKTISSIFMMIAGAWKEITS